MYIKKSVLLFPFSLDHEKTLVISIVSMSFRWIFNFNDFFYIEESHLVMQRCYHWVSSIFFWAGFPILYQGSFFQDNSIK